MDQQRLILVVEDDDATRAFLLDNLAADGFRVAGASGVGDGLRAIEVRQPALVVLDLLLENGSGLHLLDRVRAADGLASRIDPELPVIVVTGRDGEADRVRSFASGADDHLSKPRRYSFSAVRSRIRGCGLLPRGLARLPARRSQVRVVPVIEGGAWRQARTTVPLGARRERAALATRRRAWPEFPQRHRVAPLLEREEVAVEARVGVESLPGTVALSRARAPDRGGRIAVPRLTARWARHADHARVASWFPSSLVRALAPG